MNESEVAMVMILDKQAGRSWTPEEADSLEKRCGADIQRSHLKPNRLVVLGHAGSIEEAVREMGMDVRMSETEYRNRWA